MPKSITLSYARMSNGNQSRRYILGRVGDSLFSIGALSPKRINQVLEGIKLLIEPKDIG